MQSDTDDIQTYLDGLPEQRRQAVEKVRQVVLDSLPAGYEEAMNWGMITWQVPLETYPDTYNGQPLMYAALASQKNHMSLYLTGIYMDEEAEQEFKEAYKATGKRYDAGKSCVRFRKLEDLPQDLIGDTLAKWEVDDFVARYERVRSRARS